MRPWPNVPDAISWHTDGVGLNPRLRLMRCHTLGTGFRVAEIAYTPARDTPPDGSVMSEAPVWGDTGASRIGGVQGRDLMLSQSIYITRPHVCRFHYQESF
jgi:hypothetical protein